MNGGAFGPLPIVDRVTLCRWLVIAFVSVPSLALAQPGSPVRLEDAIQLAMTRNERAQIANLETVIAEAGIAKARTAFLPVLAANANNTLRPRDTPIDTVTGALNLNQPILVPSAFPLLDQAHHALAAQRAQTTDDRRRLAFDTCRRFFDVLLADQVLEAARKKLDTAKADVDATQAQAKAQLVSTNDVTRARIGLSGSTREVANDQGNVQTATIQLALIVNAPVTGKLEVPTALLASGERPPPPVDKLVAAGLAQRPDLLARKNQLLASKDFAREPRYRFFPTLALNAQVSATSNAGPNGHDIETQVAVTASWTIFDAGSRSADARARDASAAIADLEAAALARTIEAEVRSAVVALDSAQQALGAARDAMDAARKSADETAILYHQGLAKAIELLDANEQRFSAEVNFALARYGVANAYLALREAMGLDPIGGDL